MGGSPTSKRGLNNGLDKSAQMSHASFSQFSPGIRSPGLKKYSPSRKSRVSNMNVEIPQPPSSPGRNN